VLGVVKKVKLEQEVVDALRRKLLIHVDVASQFTRAVVGGVKYYSQAYTRVTKRNSYTVCYKDGGATQYGLIKYFLSLQNQSVAVVNKLRTTSDHCYAQGLGILCSRVVPVKLQSSVEVIPIKCLMSKCVYCSFSSTNIFIAVPPNCITDD
jgi:hypothetical protein